MNKLSEWLRNDSISLQQRAKQFLNKGGYKTDIKNPQKILDKLSERFPDEFYSFCELTELRAEDGRSYPEIYETKNETKEFSLQISSIFQGDVWVNWIELIVNIFDKLKLDKPEKILDLGSDNGIITCFLAAYFPDAEVIGVERSENGIKVSKSVAEKLGIGNVNFINSDATDFLESNPGSFDLINSLTFLKEASKIFESRIAWAFSVSQKESNAPEICKETVNFLEKISQILSPNGNLISCERIGNSDGCRLFLDHFHESGFEVKHSEALHLVNWQQETETLPLFVFYKAKTRKSRISFLEANEVMTNFDRTLPAKTNLPIIDETYTAWMVFESFSDKTLLKGALLVYERDEGAIMLGEVWQTKYCTVWIKRSVRGYGELSLYSGNQNAYAFEKLRSIITSHEQRRLGEIFEYQSLDSLNKKLTDLGHPDLVVE